MAPQPALESPVPAMGCRWNLATRLGFRFCLLYFSFFSLTTQILGVLLSFPGFDFPDPSTPLHPLISWTASHVFHLSQPLVYAETGSGDRTSDWMLCLVLLVLSSAGVALWSALDRRRDSYLTLHKWFRLAIRVALGTQMLSYGFVKLVPLQMSFPYLTKLVEPYGNFSPMGVLWGSIGASPAYEMFAGSAEVLAGILLLVPRTALLGALICLADTIQIFTLNMTYDVPVKLLSFHLLLMSVFLLAPELSRLERFFLSDTAVEPSRQPALFATAKRNRWALIAQLVFLVWQLANNGFGAWQAWGQYGGGRPKSALYGIWNVEESTVNGKPVQPQPNDKEQWRRIIFDFPKVTYFQHMDDSMLSYITAIDSAKRSIALTRVKQSQSNLSFERIGQDQLTLDGTLSGNAVHMRLRLQDRNRFELISRGFHWIQERPYSH